MQTSVVIAWTIAVLVEIAFPVVLASWFWQRYRVKGRVFFYGALIFFLFQIVARIPLVGLLNRSLAPYVQDSQTLTLLYLAGLGLTAGLFESVGRWAGYKWLFRQGIPHDWQNGVAYGIGHGGIESALLVGLGSALSLVQAVIITGMSVAQLQETFPVEGIQQVLDAREQFMSMSWGLPLWGAVERLFTLPFHIAMSLIVLLVFVRGQTRWLWVAVALHALVDFTTPAMVQFLSLPTWAIELWIGLWGAMGLWLVLKLKPSLETRSS